MIIQENPTKNCCQGSISHLLSPTKFQRFNFDHEDCQDRSISSNVIFYKHRYLPILLVFIVLNIITKADLPLVDGDYCWADGKSVSTYDRSQNDSSFWFGNYIDDGSIFVALLISTMMMVLRIDNGFCPARWLQSAQMLESLVTERWYHVINQI